MLYPPPPLVWVLKMIAGGYYTYVIKKKVFVPP